MMEEVIFIIVFIIMFALPLAGLEVLEKYLTKKGH